MRDILINNILTWRLKMKFTDYIYSNPKKIQRSLNESKIPEFIYDYYPFYAAEKNA